MLYIQNWLFENGPDFDRLYRDFGVRSRIYPNDCVILNYSFGDKKHPIVRECRGLQISLSDFSVISRAFERFFNYGEIDDGFVFDEKTTVREKVDGSLVILYFHKGGWHVRTRGTAYAEERLNYGKTGEELVLSAMRRGFLDFPGLDPSLSYVFELTCPENRVVTPYKDRNLYYLACFNNNEGYELPCAAGLALLDGLFPFKLPRQYVFDSVKAVIDAAKELPDLEEGYVAQDAKGVRVKIKNPAYVALHALRGNGLLSGEKALALIESGEDGEYVSYFAEDAGIIAGIRKKRDDLLSEAESVFKIISRAGNRKDFAEKALGYPFSALLFQMLDGKSAAAAWETLKTVTKEKLVLAEEK